MFVLYLQIVGDLIPRDGTDNQAWGQGHFSILEELSPFVKTVLSPHSNSFYKYLSLFIDLFQAFIA